MNADELNNHRQRAKEFAENGGTEALYWADLMSLCVRYLECCPTLNISEGLADLFRIKDEYDFAILKRSTCRLRRALCQDIRHEQNNKTENDMKREKKDLYKIAERMKNVGGSFAQHLGVAMLYADPDNLRRIEAAFPELMIRYSQYEEAGE